MAALPGAWHYRVSAGIGRPGVSILWLCEVESWSETSISVWQHVKLSEQIRPWDTLACCWDVKQPTNKQSSSAFDLMVALTRSSLPWVLHTWMSGPNPLQTPRARYWGTHKLAISAALLAGGVSRTAGNVLVFGPPLHRGTERRSLRQSSWDDYSILKLSI